MDQPSEVLKELNRTVPCYAATIFSENGIWHGTNPLVQVIPLFIAQQAFAIFWNRLVLLAFKPFKQPRFVAEVIGGILLGPSGLGRSETFSKKLFPPLGFKVLDPMAHFALVYHAFLIGLETDLEAIPQAGKRAFSVAIAGIIFPFILGACLFIPFRDKSSSPVDFIFWASTLTVTGCSVLGRTLDKLKILQTDMARTALSASVINDLGARFLLSVAIALSGGLSTIHWTFFSTLAFMLLSVFYLRPALLWVLHRKPEGEGFSEYYISSVLVGVGLCGVLTDALGTHPIVGAFAFGLAIPRGELEATIVDRLEEFVSAFLMPLFFAVCGLKTDIDTIVDNTSLAMVLLVIVLASSAKIVSTVLASFLCKIEIKEAMTLGLVMNTKSILAVIILYLGLEQRALSIQTYTIMLITVLVMTITVMPIMMLNRPSRTIVPYKRRTIQKAKPEEEFRILACIHGMRNVPGIINLLEVSNPTRTSPITVFAVHLVELIGRASAVVTIHDTKKSGVKNPNHIQAQTDQIITAFEQFERRSNSVTIQPLLARSSYSTMDEDICSIAEDRRVALIILPFHRQQTLDGEMEDINPAIRDVNENVLATAPCSIGVVIDRGLAESGDFARRIAVLYFGGPDDREALSYAWRMAQHQDVSLSVVRFIASDHALDVDPMDFMSKQGMVSVNIDIVREKERDEDFLNKFKINTGDDASISYSELLLNNEEDTVTAIKAMDRENYDLYVVGKGRGMMSPLTAGLIDWCDCPELGAIGDVLVTSEFSSAFSVLVVQQYSRTALIDGSERTLSSSNNTREELEQPEWQELEEGVGGDPFASSRNFNDIHDKYRLGTDNKSNEYPH
ncbi:cation/H(+) antiporter 15-like [Cornus florida]|uniref:cation/H(+) antiporter 15-like n=1 Tax=Cornus florida TaxID=4283 RepID=UPI00289CA70E|nr:cation/H(+) antiporter 15-like [Cornus florida]